MIILHVYKTNNKYVRKIYSRPYIYLFIHTLNSVTFDIYTGTQLGVRSLYTNGHCWESNLRPFNQSNI